VPLAAAPALTSVSTTAPAVRRARPQASAFEARLAAHRAGAPSAGLALRPTPQGPAAEAAPLQALLRSAEAAQARLDRLFASARGGRPLAAGDLLVLQAEAYRFSQVLEVAGKVVEQGVQSVKQAIQTPI